MEYLLLTLDFGEILFLLAGFGSLQAALLKVLEPRGHRGTLDGPRRMTAVLWRPEGKNPEPFKGNRETRSEVRLEARWVEGSNLFDCSIDLFIVIHLLIVFSKADFGGTIEAE